MDLMNALLAQAMIDARLAQASQQRLGRQIEDDRRAARRTRRRRAMARWWRRRVSRGPDAGSRKLGVAAATPVRAPSVELAQVLEEAAHRLAAQGTSSESRLLEAMSEVAGQSAPGAAAALVDRDGTEASRLRAFGFVHTHLLEALGPDEHAWLLDLLDGAGDLERPSRVA
jgi:hypothetical protein